MALEKIIGKIREETRKEAESLVAKARAEEQDIISRGSEKAGKEKEKRIQEARDRFQNDQLRTIALASLEARKGILKTRAEIMDLVFEKALEHLRSLGMDEHRKLIQGLLDGFIPQAPCDIFIHEPDKDRYSLILSQIWGAVFIKFCKFMTVKKSLGGGFILKTPGMELDCTFPNLLKEKRSSMEQEVVKILFPQKVSM